MHLWVYHKAEDFPVLMCSGYLSYKWDSKNTLLYLNIPLSIKLNGFPCLATQYTSLRLWVSVSLPAKQWGWIGLTILKSCDSYPLGCRLLHSQPCSKWNTAHLLLRTSYQIQTQTDTVWLSCSCDLFTPLRRKRQVISELWQQPAGSQHIPGIKIELLDLGAPYELISRL